MAFFEWKEEFSVQVAEIDHQHQRLIELINQLHAAIEYSDAKATMESVLSEMDTVSAVVNEMINYARYHFSTEEKYMLQYDYPAYEEHHQQHQEFIDRVQAFVQGLEDTGKRISVDVVDFLKQWWVRHILEADKKCGAYCVERGLC